MNLHDIESGTSRSLSLSPENQHRVDLLKKDASKGAMSGLWLNYLVQRSVILDSLPSTEIKERTGIFGRIRTVLEQEKLVFEHLNKRVLLTAMFAGIGIKILSRCINNFRGTKSS